MKKLISLLLVCTLALSLAACGAKDAGSTGGSAPDDIHNTNIPLQELMDKIHEEAPVDIGLMDQALDLSDTSLARWQIAQLSEDVLESVEEGMTSDALINVQVYKLVLLRLKDGVDAQTFGQSLLDGADTGFMVCVFPDAVSVAGYGDLVCFAMTNSDILPATDLTAAFGTVLGGADFTLEKDVDADSMDGAIFAVPAL